MFVQFFRWIVMLMMVVGGSLVYGADQFIALSDIHFDPFASCRFYSSSCDLIDELQSSDVKQWAMIFEKYEKTPDINYFTDTNYSLLKLTLSEVSHVSSENKPDFIIILGDFLAHDFNKKFKKYAHHYSKQDYTQFVKKTLAFLMLEINTIEPSTNVYPVLGNNDSYTGNYKVVPNGAFLKEMSHTWAPFIKDKSNRERFQSQFVTGGYYAVQLPGRHDRIIVLNTVLFSVKSQTDAVKQAAVQQLNWLNEQLSDAKQNHESVIIAYHIPMGIDVIKTIQVGFGTIKEFWMPDYKQSFEALLKAYPLVISDIISGHVHLDTLQLFTSQSIIPEISVPSISPIYGNNPGFKIIHYDEESFKLDNIRLYDYPLNRAKPAWQLD